MLGGLSLRISVCRTRGFGHKPGLWGTPGAQHEPPIAMCPMECVAGLGMLMLNFLHVFLPSTCAGCVKAQSN